MEGTRDRLAGLVKRLRQPVSVQERAATEAELAKVARQAAPPRERAERRPKTVGEKR